MRACIYKYKYMLISVMMATLLGMTACDIHEYPAVSETASHEVLFKFNVESMFDCENVEEWIYRDTTRSYIPSGTMRYTVRLYPITSNGKTSTEYVQEYILYHDVADMYGETFTLELLPGKYELMAWADLEIPGTDREFYYDPTNFSEITLARHQGNTDYRDGLRGTKEVTIYSDMYEREPELIIMDMERPLAKYEVISDDLDEFIDKLIASGWAEKNGLVVTEGVDETDGSPTKNIDLDELVVKIIYPGYMPSAYSMFSDKPVDATLGNYFESRITQLSETEASLGFDYVFVNGEEGVVTIQIAIHGKNDEKLLSLSSSMNIPISRNVKTIVKGSFMMQDVSGGIDIDTEFDGELDVKIPG